MGRVVIPKEIRRTMRIREGDPLEIYTDADGEVIFKKYSPIGELPSPASMRRFFPAAPICPFSFATGIMSSPAQEFQRGKR